MTTIRLSAKTGIIMTFDGAVLEVFKYQRIHVGNIDKIELTTDKRGSHMLTVFGDRISVVVEVDESAASKVAQVVEEVKKAKTALRFD